MSSGGPRSPSSRAVHLEPERGGVVTHPALKPQRGQARFDSIEAPVWRSVWKPTPDKPARLAAGACTRRRRLPGSDGAPSRPGNTYQNFIDPALSDWKRAYYGANLHRLIRVKRAYDPDELFKFPQSIPA
jgi:hypothetical protein